MQIKATPKKELYPIIADIINQRFRQTRAWISRDEIIFGLLQRSESSSTINSNWKRILEKIEAGGSYQEWETTLEGYAGNWVDWFSAKFDNGRYDRQFQRVKDSNNNWAYRPK